MPKTTKRPPIHPNVLARAVGLYLQGPAFQEVISSARIVVRETGFVAQYIEGNQTIASSIYNTAMNAYDMAVLHLQKIDPDAEKFVKSTYGPSFRNIEVKP